MRMRRSRFTPWSTLGGTLGRTVGGLLAALASLTACQNPGPLGGSSARPPSARPPSVIERVALPPANARQPAAEDGWELVWSDEFDGPEIDRDKWQFDVDCWGGGNDERQCYRDDPRNAAVENGQLVITARREQHTGPAFPVHLRGDAASQAAQATKPYTSAKLSTRGKAAWRYGRVEVRARLPQGQGTWPAIWMLPEGETYGSWAASGEIDIIEAVNLGVPCAACPDEVESTILGTLHFGGQWPMNALNSSEMYAPQVLDGFHTFGIVWAPGVIEWTLDGRVYARKQADDWWTTSSSAALAPFDRPFHLVINLAIGGRLPEERNRGGVEETGFPKQLAIDHVRVWRCAAIECGTAH